MRLPDITSKCRVRFQSRFSCRGISSKNVSLLGARTKTHCSSEFLVVACDVFGHADATTRKKCQTLCEAVLVHLGGDNAMAKPSAVVTLASPETGAAQLLSIQEATPNLGPSSCRGVKQASLTNPH